MHQDGEGNGGKELDAMTRQKKRDLLDKPLIKEKKLFWMRVRKKKFNRLNNLLEKFVYNQTYNDSGVNWQLTNMRSVEMCVWFSTTWRYKEHGPQT